MPEPRPEALRELILNAREAYYNGSEPLMSDAEYDALEDQFRRVCPNDPVLAAVGAAPPVDGVLAKARHTIAMGSQNKVNSEADFRKWHLKAGGGRIHASLKGDGGSVAVYYRDGRAVQAITRGDGTEGEDITANALRFEGIPAWVGTPEAGFTGAVRVEVVLSVAQWSRVDPLRTTNPRNVGNGIMGRSSGAQSELLTAIAFDLEEVRDGRSVVFATEEEKTRRLGELGFIRMPHQDCASIEEAILYFEQIARTRDKLPFWIDGVVMKLDAIDRQRALGESAGRPKGQVAWKFDSAGAQSVVEEVVITGGHTGALIPNARFRPVQIGGTTVSSASLSNFDEIARLDLAVGDRVFVVKANDIIPKITRVTLRPADRRPIAVPEVCPFCGGTVGRKATVAGAASAVVSCLNETCPQKALGKVARWIASLNILGIGDAVLSAMVEGLGLEDAADLYTLQDRAGELAALRINDEKDIRLGEKRAARILEAIQSTRRLTLSRFLGSLGLDHLGKRRVALMMKAAAGALDTLEDWRVGKLRDPRLAEQAGAPNIGGPIQDAIDAMSPVIDKLLANGVQILPSEEDTDAARPHAAAAAATATRTLCISGRLPSGKKKADYAAPLAAANIALVDVVARGLDFLVLADPDSSSSKAQKARQLGIAIIGEERLVELSRCAA
jgi:DNA ligase (NAD+)